MDHNFCLQEGNSEAHLPPLLVESPGCVLQKLRCSLLNLPHLCHLLIENHQGSRAHSGVQDPRTPEGPALRHRAADMPIPPALDKKKRVIGTLRQFFCPGTSD